MLPVYATVLQSCNAGMEAPKSVVKPESKITQSNPVTANSEGQKPWSIFGDVYWI